MPDAVSVYPQAASRRSEGQLTVTQAAGRWRSTNDLPRHCLIAFPEPEPAQFRTLDVSWAAGVVLNNSQWWRVRPRSHGLARKTAFSPSAV